MAGATWLNEVQMDRQGLIDVLKAAKRLLSAHAGDFAATTHTGAP